MPLFDFECTACGARAERLVAAARADDASCDRCGAPMKRLLPVIAGLGGKAMGSDAPAPVCGQGACGNC